MSLQLVANHLAQKGRGPDSTLVHMSNREVAGLQALAQKHGGQLSVNPDTGLPEAGFLDNILPMVAGAGLSAFTGIDPMTSAAIVGGITALDSKDLSKGLVAGLGAYGGAGMAGGLATLGGAESLATATPAQYGAGFNAFTDAPMQSLRTLGGGSALTGSLPILAGLAPAAAEAIDEEEGDEAPAQHKGYIRKYELDPVTGQYKQVGAYEAGGDPNVDVSDKAGTAGAFGAVGQSEYEAAQGMAEGGTATDSSRIYDYLMGRGSNPMQFTSASRPRVDYNLPKTDAPITPTTPILEEVYDPYGNRSGGGMDAEGRAEQQAETAKRMDAWQASDPEGYAKRNDWIGEVLSAGPLFQLGKAAINYFKPDPDAYKKISPPDQFEGYYPGDTSFRVPSFIKNMLPAVSLEPSYYSTPGLTDLKNPIPGTVLPGDGSSAPLPQGDPAQQAAIRDRINNTDFSGMDRGRVQGEGAAPSGGGAPPSGAGGYGGGGDGAAGRGEPGGDRGGWGRGGGYAHGGIANLHQYNLGSYSDGGRLLKGPGDGVSDDIPATIGNGQPARLADGEFVIPARIVSELGNGSTDAGARELYKMMDRIQAGRKKTVGKDQVAKNSKSVRHLPA